MDSNTTHSGSDKKNTMRTEEICCSFCTTKFASRMGLYHHFHNQHGISQAFRGYSVFAESRQAADLGAPSVATSGNNSSISAEVSQPEPTNERANDVIMPEVKAETFVTNIQASTSVPSIFTTAVSISPPIANVTNSVSQVKLNASKSDNSSTSHPIGKFIDQTATPEPMQVSIDGQSTKLTPENKLVTNNGLLTAPLLAYTTNDIRTSTKTLSQSRIAPSQQFESSKVSTSNQPNTILYNRRNQSFYPPSSASPSIQSGAPRFFNTSPATVNIMPSLQTRPHLQLKGVDSAENINSEDEAMTNEPLPSVTLHYMPAVGIFPGFSQYPIHYHPYDITMRTSYLYDPNYSIPNSQSTNPNGT